jgi:hypothetical protein
MWSKKSSYNEFVNDLKLLEENNILVKEQIFGYKKKFRDVLVDNNLAYFKLKSYYIKSIIDNKEYCITNGQFNKHITKNNMTEFEYLEKCNIFVPIGYKFINKYTSMKQIKAELLLLENGNNLYYTLRSVFGSVSYNYEKLMLFYGISEDEAKEISNKKIKKISDRTSGEGNCNYGKKGLNANCYKPFLKYEDPKAEMRKIMSKKRRNMILKWASNNEIDIVNFKELQFLYYSTMFKKIYMKKGEEYKNIYNLETIEQGIYLFRKQQGIKCYNPKNFFNHYNKVITLYGNEYDKAELVDFIKNEDYQSIVNLGVFIQIGRPQKRHYGQICEYESLFGYYKLKSKLEKRFVQFIEKLDFIQEMHYENIRIPYIDEEKNKQRKYYVDFEIILNNGNKFLIEVKPYCLCVIPEGLILYKKKAAEDYALQHNYKYLFMTEKDFKDDLIRKRLSSY